MNKFIVSSIVALSLASAGFASAQVYGCVSIPTGLGIGASGASVSSLQTFLVAQNYPGGGSWMETGYFGAATAAALRNFQQLQGLPQSGSTDAATVAAISRTSCGGYSAIATPTYQYTYPTIPTTYPSSYSYPSYLSYNGNAPTIQSLSQNTGTSGNAVTVYGVGFDPYNNTVNFGGTSLAGIASPNGTSLSFIIPSTVYSYSLAGTSVQLSISDSRGTSNSVSFTIWGSPYTCGSYGYGTCNGCSYNPYLSGYGYNSSCYSTQPQSSTPVISYLSPLSGGVGTNVTIYGSGFSNTGNSIRFGTGVIANVGSADGRGLSFVVPSYLTGYGSQPVTLSTYQVSVVNAYGVISNSVPFAVTSLGSSGQPVIASVNGPTALSVGQQGLWTLNMGASNNSYLTVSVNWGDQNVYGATAASQPVYAGQTSTFTHTYYTPGTYTALFTVWSGAGQQSSYSTTVTVTNAGTYGVPSISYLSPNTGHVGQQVTIYGSGFSSNSTILFGGGAIQNVYSSSGSVITFTVPSSVAPYCAPGTACPQYVIQITPGIYNVSIMGQNGTSNQVPFTVQ